MSHCLVATLVAKSVIESLHCDKCRCLAIGRCSNCGHLFCKKHAVGKCSKDRIDPQICVLEEEYRDELSNLDLRYMRRAELIFAQRRKGCMCENCLVMEIAGALKEFESLGKVGES